MSMNTEIACRRCKETLWIGQGDYIYQESFDALNSFLQKHRYHPLEFGYFDDADSDDPVMNYKKAATDG